MQIEIVEGNLKSIMKLILAVAAHFKPSNIKQQQQLANNNPVTRSSQINKKSLQTTTTTTITPSNSSVKQGMHNYLIAVENKTILKCIFYVLFIFAK